MIANTTVPGIRTRWVDTAAEMNAGQTLALAGLIQTQVESENRGLPWLADLPWVGAAFRRVEEQNNEVELLILVTPEFVDALDPHEVPPCGPGQLTTSPNDVELYWRGYVEVPRCCEDGSCGQCQEAAAAPSRNSGPALRGAGIDPSAQRDSRGAAGPHVAGAGTTLLPFGRHSPDLDRACRIRPEEQLRPRRQLNLRCAPTATSVRATNRGYEPPMSNVLRLAIVDPNDGTRETLKSMLLGMDMVWLEAECSRYEFFADVVGQTHPEIGVVSIDHDAEKALQLIQDLQQTAPDCSILVISSSTDGQVILKSMRAGAKEFLTHPLRVEDLVASIERIGNHRYGRGEGRVRNSSVVAVAGATGGVGTTSLAVNLGCAMATRPGTSVALIDLDLALGDADVFLDTIPDYTLVDVAQNISRLDFALLKRSLTKHSSGLYLLPRPIQLQDTSLIAPDDLQRVIGLLKATFSHLIFDLSKSYTAVDMVGAASRRAYSARDTTGPAFAAQCRPAADVHGRNGRLQGESEDRRQSRGAGQRPDQHEEGGRNARPRRLLAHSQRLPSDGGSPQ